MPVHLLLAHVLRAVAAWVPDRFGVLLAADRFADGRAALRRVAEPDGAAAASGWLAPDEARRLLDTVLSRWAALGEVEVPPLAVILPPDQTGTGDYRLAVYGVADGWTASWTGPVTPAPDGCSARPEPEVADGIRVGARVFARTPAGRTVLNAVPAR